MIETGLALLSSFLVVAEADSLAVEQFVLTGSWNTDEASGVVVDAAGVTEAIDVIKVDTAVNAGLIKLHRKHRILHAEELIKQLRTYQAKKAARHEHRRKVAGRKCAKKRYATLFGRLYACYYNMKQRCTNPDHEAFKRYGGVGVKCLFIDFNDFRDYVINKLGFQTVASLHGLDVHRIDNKDYKRGNIIFLTRKEHGAAHRILNAETRKAIT